MPRIGLGRNVHWNRERKVPGVQILDAALSLRETHENRNTHASSAIPVSGTAWLVDKQKKAFSSLTAVFCGETCFFTSEESGSSRVNAGRRT